jgi:uncharacterized OB-fold protein
VESSVSWWILRRRKDNAVSDTEHTALRLLTEQLGATVLDGGYCPKCGREYQPDSTCSHCDRATA